MSTSISAQMQASATNIFEMVANVAGLSGDIDVTVAIGTAGAPPATFAALGSAEQFRTIYSDDISLVKGPTGTSFTQNSVVQPIGAVGGTLYAGVWNHAPAGGDAPLATAGPFVIGR